MKTILILVTMVALTGIASAAMTGRLVEIDNSASLSGYVTNDIVISTDSDWLLSTLKIQPDAPGQIYQNSYGNYGPPASALVNLFPTLAYDSFVSAGLVIDGDVPTLSPGSVFTEDLIDCTYFTFSNDDIGDLTIARITLSTSANGTWSIEALNTETGSQVPAWEIGPNAAHNGIIENGLMKMVPEPATMLVMIAGGISLLARRRRK